MPVNRKQQVLAKVETSEGVAATLAAGDAVLVFDPALSDSVDIQSRVPAGPTLSRDFDPVGRQTRQLTFRSDFRGSGDTSIPVTEPDFGKFLKACGYKLSSLVRLTCGAITGSGYQLGEIVNQSSGAIRGVVVGILHGADPNGVPQMRTTTTGAFLIIATIVGTFAAAATTGESSGSTNTASAVAAFNGVGYQPTSEKLMNMATAAWSGTDPDAVGEVLKVESPAGTVIGAVQIIRDNGSMTNIDVTLLFLNAGATIVSGTTLRSAGNGTTTLSADPTQVATPSLTIRHNLDGRQRDLLGARGDFTLEGEAGGPMQFSWTFSGDLAAGVDAPPISTTGLSAIRPPRLLGAICVYGNGAGLFRLPTKRVTVANGGTVNPNLDANRAGGATGSNVTDRDPSIQVTVDQVHSAFDWEDARNNGTTIRVAFLLGTAQGNLVAVVAPVCQVTEVTLAEGDGIATFDVTLRPRRIQESGDDEIYIAQL